MCAYAKLALDGEWVGGLMEDRSSTAGHEAGCSPAGKTGSAAAAAAAGESREMVLCLGVAAREVQAAAVFYKPYGQQANPTPESAGEMSGYT